ncbi:MAG: hypothetical protein EP318_06815 [Rhodobacteraceae bacterium]|nr:MAG: hypothetical protein EP318_06815 [Paracoccaceae bacterium]
MTERFKVQYFGTFTMVAPDGRDVTPRGSKARGLLALVCEAGNMRRGRRWLESMLWSDRSPAQARGSLRQTLTELRQALGSARSVLSTNRLEVWLDPALVDTDLDPRSGLRAPDRALLEGLDVRDPAFDGWKQALETRLAETGAALPAAPPETGAPHKLTIRAALSQAGSAIERITSQIVADQVAKTLEDRLSSVRFADYQRRPSQAAPDIEIRCDVAEDGQRGVVFLRVESGHDGQLLFSDHRSVPGVGSDILCAEVIAGLVHSAASKIVHRLPTISDLHRPEVAALGYSSLGLRKLARFDPQAIDAAQGYFHRAYEADSNGVYLAWRAFVRMAQLVEGAGGAHKALLEETQALTRRSLESAQDNGLAMALVALTRIMLEDDLQQPAELAQQAMLWNDNNLFARQTLAVAHSAVGDTKKAYELSSACRRAAPDDDELSHLWDLYHALVCISAGRLPEARLAAARACAAAPGFVAPRRQLVALCANAGDMKGARMYLDQLKGLEPGFSLDRYLNDPDYPNLTLRKAGLIDPLRRLDLEG